MQFDGLEIFMSFRFFIPLILLPLAGCSTNVLRTDLPSAEGLVDTRIAESASTISLAQRQLHETRSDSPSSLAGPVSTTGGPAATTLKFSETPTVVSTKSFSSTPMPAPTIVNVIAAPVPVKTAESSLAALPFATLAGQTLSSPQMVASLAQSNSSRSIVSEPSAVAKPLEVPWVVLPSDVTLRRALVKWAARAGWQLVWEASVDVPISVNASFSGDFRTAVKGLFQSLSAADVNLIGMMYAGNRVLRVTESGRRAQ